MATTNPNRPQLKQYQATNGAVVKESPLIETSDQSGKTKSSTNFADTFADSIARMGVAKLFVVLAMILYGVVAFSKEDKGVLTADLISLFSFLLFVVVLLFSLYLATHLYRDFILKKDSILSDLDKKQAKVLILSTSLLIFLFLVIIYYHSLVRQVTNIFSRLFV